MPIVISVDRSAVVSRAARECGVAVLPTGTVTFVFTDIEASTRLLSSLGAAFAELLAEQRALIRDVSSGQGGTEFGSEGDACFLVFPSAPSAVRAAVEIQRRLTERVAGSEESRAVRVRIGIHTGEGMLYDGDYVGIDVHRVARITAAAHGEQIVLSEATRNLVEGRLPPCTSLRNLGEHRLKDLHTPERLYQIDVEGLRQEFAPLRAEGAPGKLPALSTSFIGRERELLDAARLLRQGRLLTVTGPGGTGKTRLAVELAGKVRNEFRSGVWFVPLATVVDPKLVPSAIAEVLGLTEILGETRTPLQRVITHLHGRELLLLLDNFEHLQAAAGVVNELLASAPGAKIVVTSRSPLRLSGEQEFPLLPLSFPDPGSSPSPEALLRIEAVALFVDRARAVRPEFALTEENAAPVAELCARLDGLPLAIELAASRIRLLAPAAMLARLDDRLALLGAGMRDLPARHATLRQSVAWSYDLLSRGEQRLLSRLAVFVRGWTLDAAEQICGPAQELGMDVLEGLESLVENSLIVVQEAGADARFTMLETIRIFALDELERVGEAEEMRRRHASAFLSLAQEAAPRLPRRKGRRWFELLELEHDNCRAALDWSIRWGEVTLTCNLVAALWRFWQMGGHLHEGRGWAERCLKMRDLSDHPRERLKVLEAAGGLAYWQLDRASEQFYREAQTLSEELGDPLLLANALYNRSFEVVAEKKEEWDTSVPRAYLKRSLNLYRRLNDASGVIKVQWALGNVAATEGRYKEAVDYLETSLAGADALGDDFLVGWSLYTLARIDAHLGRVGKAEDRFRETLHLFAQLRDLSGILFQLDGLAAVALAQGDHERAVRLGGAVSTLRASTGANLVMFDPTAQLESVTLDPEELKRITEEGEAMSIEGAVAYGLGTG